MNYIDIGKENKEVIVFIHGLASRKEAWESQHELSNKYRLLIPDLRGHGDNELMEGINIQTFANDVIELLDSLGIEKANFCGLSMGGLVSQEIYKRYPERVNKLILSNTLFYSIPFLSEFFINSRKRKLNKVSEEEFTQQALQRCIYRLSDEELKDKAKRAFKLNKESYIKAGRSCLQQNNICLLPKVKAKTLVIGGLYDKVTPVIISKQIHKLIPNSQFVVFDEVGHVANIEVPDKFNRLVDNFLMN